MKRKDLAKSASEKAKGTRIGRIVLPIALAGVGLSFFFCLFLPELPEPHLHGSSPNAPAAATQNQAITSSIDEHNSDAAAGAAPLAQTYETETSETDERADQT